MKIYMIFISLFFLILVGCISGPVDSEKSFAENLNGESYKNSNPTPSLFAVPVNLVRKDVQRRFSGKVFCGEGISQHPVNNASIALRENLKILASTSSLADGSYLLVAETTSTGPFSLQATAGCGKSDQIVTSKAEGRIPSYDIFLK